MSFTPVESTIGGVAIGVAAGATLLHHGRIAGISGMLGSLFEATGDDLLFRTMFLGGLVAGTAAATWSGISVVIAMPAIGLGQYAIAGALVGAGTNIGHGCTSGHGICGLGRMSPRSMVNVLSFMTAGFVTSALLFPMASSFGVAPLALPSSDVTLKLLAGAVVLPTTAIWLASQFKSVALSALAIGTTFGVGLSVSGMTDPAKVGGFLRVFSGRWDPSLACVMGGGLAVSLLSYRRKATMRAPVIASTFKVPVRTDFQWDLVVGGALFGVGWAIAGMCPGPAIANLSLFDAAPLVFLASLMATTFATEKVRASL